MAKKRKTKEQKKLADLRHNFTHSLVKNSISEAKISLVSKTKAKTLSETPNTKTENEYPYLIKDLSKTTMLTAGILTVQFVLFFLLKNHIISIPGLIY
jgi:hypothetical protein